VPRNLDGVSPDDPVTCPCWPGDSVARVRRFQIQHQGYSPARSLSGQVTIRPGHYPARTLRALSGQLWYFTEPILTVFVWIERIEASPLMTLLQTLIPPLTAAPPPKPIRETIARHFLYDPSGWHFACLRINEADKTISLIAANEQPHDGPQAFHGDRNGTTHLGVERG
jgi:hypothetical protein